MQARLGNTGLYRLPIEGRPSAALPAAHTSTGSMEQGRLPHYWVQVRRRHPNAHSRAPLAPLRPLTSLLLPFLSSSSPSLSTFLPSSPHSLLPYLISSPPFSFHFLSSASLSLLPSPLLLHRADGHLERRVSKEPAPCPGASFWARGDFNESDKTRALLGTCHSDMNKMRARGRQMHTALLSGTGK